MGIVVKARAEVCIHERGAVDLDACPTRMHGQCRCGPCDECGYQKHTAIHGPALGQPPGSEPWGHEYKPYPGGRVFGRKVQQWLAR